MIHALRPPYVQKSRETPEPQKSGQGKRETLLRWNYATDAEGNITAITNPNDAADSRSFGYQDVQYFLTTGNGPWGNLSWSYDQIGNRLSETRDGVTDTYSYLANAGSGNTAILQQIQLGIGGFKTYTYGPAGYPEEVNAGGHLVDFTSDAAGGIYAGTVDHGVYGLR